ncbi:MAG: TetR/AcrR family transcriptional regulator [Candidatus Eremiobacteraeota bacterium]|nr:TetR/AcrR family transcriptional regulator [Candidatus Eremiobacteraeota bacterium]
MAAVEATADRREDTRVRILSAARELYAARGSRGTTTREVAELAGVNEATLFRHFGTKQQLLFAMLDHFSATSTLHEVFPAALSLSDIGAQLRMIGQQAVEHIALKEDLIKVAMAEEIVDPAGVSCTWRGPAEARTRLAEFMRAKTHAGELRGDPDFLARVFLSLCFSLVIARRLWSDFPQPRERALDAMVDIFLNGAGTK